MGPTSDGAAAAAPAEPHPVSPGSRVARATPSAAVVFGAAIGLSAFLLFSVEPLVGRLVLPVFGGTPAVWATVLFFFQGVLLLGYLYAHLSVRLFGARRGVAVHLVVVGVALAALVLAPGRAQDLRIPGAPAAIELLVILVGTAGLPAFAMTATTPLLSAWFAAVRAARGEDPDPYWLYALSNAGSFVALFAYPFLIEPNFGLATQRTGWLAGLVLLAGLLAAAGWLVRRAPTDGVVVAAPAGPELVPPVTSTAPATPRLPIDWFRRARWVLLAAIPSGLLAAVTNYIATDFISAPLIWLGPLAIYLASFVVAFSARGRRIVPIAVRLAPAAVTLLWVPLGSAAVWPIGLLLALELGALLVVSTALHGRLALDRPDHADLTEFYLVVSAGGVLASAFVALVAPLVFDGVWEYPILLVGALLALAVGADRSGRRARRPGRLGLDFGPLVVGFRWRVLPYVAVAVAITTLVPAGGIQDAIGRWLFVGAAVLAFGSRPSFVVIMTSLVLGLAVFVLPPTVLFRDRSFFGVTEVIRTDDRTTLWNGTTIHGLQATDPSRRREPMSYYDRGGPLGDVFAVLDGGATGGGDPPAGEPARGRSIGVVGLGTGTLAAYERAGDELTFYEIDPLVVRVASDPAYFTFLTDAPVRPAIVLGDARLSLEAVRDDAHDILALDAFSSDAIPAHLLTVEAIRDDLRVVRPGGILAVHVSNRYYDLAPAVAAAGKAVGATVLVRDHQPPEPDLRAGIFPSRWLVVVGPELVGAFEARGWRVVPDGAVPLTDDYPNLLRFLHWPGG